MAMMTAPMTTVVVAGLFGPGLAAAALAGAVGLGLAAAALNRGGGGGKGHGGYGRRRRRRQVGTEKQRIERLLEVIRKEDNTGCGLKLVCELGGRLEDDLAEEELAILNLIGPSVKPGEGVMPSAAIEEYRMARGLGETGGDCNSNYFMCPLSGQQLIESVVSYVP